MCAPMPTRKQTRREFFPFVIFLCAMATAAPHQVCGAPPNERTPRGIGEVNPNQVQRLVTGDAERIGSVVAGTGATLKFYFTPRPPRPGTQPSLAYPAGWNINGRKLTVSGGGFTSAWITQIEGWDADQNGVPLLRSFQDKIDASGFMGSQASPSNPNCDLIYPANIAFPCQKTCVGGLDNGANCAGAADCRKACDAGNNNGVPCTNNSNCPGGSCVGACGDPCAAIMGEAGPRCGASFAGFCDWVWQDKTNPNWVFASIQGNSTPVASGSSPTGPIWAGTTWPGYEVSDQGLRYYTGSFVLPVPTCCKGVYTMGHDGFGTFFQDQAQPANNVPIAALVPGVLECQIGSCCTDFTAPSSGTCTPGLSIAECNALHSTNLHIFRPDSDCNTPCFVECLSDADCDDEVYCDGAETCVDTHCVTGDPPCGFGETCDETNDSCGITPIPTVSQWGLAILTITLLIAAKISLRRRRSCS